MSNTNNKAPLCACGCGQSVIKNRSGKFNRYIHGHNSKSSDNTGKWRPGQSGNPAGCKTGSRNRVTRAAEHVLTSESGAIARRCVDMALDGDRQMIKLVLERCVPVKKSVPIHLPDMPKISSVSDASSLTGYVLQAVADGRLSPVDGEIISRSAERHLRALQVTDLEIRLVELEQQFIGKGDSV